MSGSSSTIENLVHRLGHGVLSVHGSVKLKRAPAARAALRLDLPAVSAHDRLADGQPQSHAHHGALVAAALKLVEQPRRIPGRQPRTLVVQRHAHEIALRLQRGRYRGARAGRSVLGNVVEQVGENLHDQLGVDPHRRQIRGQMHLDAVAGELVAVGAERAADQVIERLPVAPQHHLARFEAHQVENVGDQLRHLARLGLHRARQLHRASLRRDWRRAAPSVLPAPAITASGVRRSWEMDASSVLRSVSRSAARLDASATSARRARSRASPICPAKVPSRWLCSGSSTRRTLFASTASTPTVRRSSPSGTYSPGAAGSVSEPSPARRP